MARLLPLTRGMVAIVDDADFDSLAEFPWIAKPADHKAKNWYAYRTDGRRSVYLHRLLLAAPKGMFVDHINGNGLDNRRANLRLCTRGENNTHRNYPLPESGFRGVHRDKGRWCAQVEFQGLIVRARLPTPELAARAYDALAREFQGEFAILNFPNRRAA